MAVKEYRVIKDGEVLKTYKSLPAAKQLAEKEIANVYVGDECVYKVVPDEKAEEKVDEPVETPEEKTTTFTLTTLMNVRKAPSMTAQILKTLPAGTKVDVDAVVDDWLHLSDGTFILYNGGKFATKD